MKLCAGYGSASEIHMESQWAGIWGCLVSSMIQCATLGYGGLLVLGHLAIRTELREQSLGKIPQVNQGCFSRADQLEPGTANLSKV